MTMEDVRLGVFDPKKLKASLQFQFMQTFRPVGGIGTIASFDLNIPGLIKIKSCRLRRREGESIRLTTGRLDDGRGFSVEIPRWLRQAILDGAIAAIRANLEIDLAALQMDAASAEEPDQETAGLARMLKKAPSTWLPKMDEPWLS
jgi:hypothetical protein